MTTSLTSHTLLEKLKNFVSSRFIYEDNNAVMEDLLFSTPEGLVGNQILRLRRHELVESWKTILFVSLASKEQLRMAFRWAANVKDDIGIKEATDLYLIGIFEDDFLSDDEILGYENNELFCRKFFLKKGETAECLFERTFLARLLGDKDSSKIDDPLSLALAKTFEKNKNFDPNAWRIALLSGKTGTELIEELF